MNSEVKFAWVDLATSSQVAFVIVQFLFLVSASVYWIKHLIDTRIGGSEAIEIRSWPRVIVGVIACNGVFLLMHHFYLRVGPSIDARITFIAIHFLTTITVSLIVSLLGFICDGGNAIWVRTDRYKPEHSANLIDMTKNNGRHAQLIPRGAINAYMLFVLFTWIVIFTN